MATLIKRISDGTIIEFDKGSFDDWCVYVARNGQNRYAPKDLQYFTALNDFGARYGHGKIYADFVRIYELTDSKINENILSRITEISKEYGDDKIVIDIWFTVIYAGMIAEENKQFAILKKRVKRLGMHQLLIDRKAPEFAANFSKGKKWRELDVIMRESGF